MINIIKVIILILILLLITIYIVYYLKHNEYFKQNYIGPIIFLQKNNTEKSEINCLNENSYYNCIGKYPEDKYYPTNTDLKYLSTPTIIKIPKGKTGDNGEKGKNGISDKIIYTAEIKNINSNKLSLKNNNTYFNSNNNYIRMKNNNIWDTGDYQNLCIINQHNNVDNKYCIDRKILLEVNNSFKNENLNKHKNLFKFE